jgi:hypothetical protein
LPRLVAAGLLVPVPRGTRCHGFRAADVERLVERGYQLSDAGTKLPRSKRRLPAKGNAELPKRISDLPY